jgi:hypothetical protein
MTREFILKEIKRTAEANGGRALERQRFIQETGINEYNWKGKIWARWGDAVREAGYSPGELRTAFADAYLRGVGYSHAPARPLPGHDGNATTEAVEP